MSTKVSFEQAAVNSGLENIKLIGKEFQLDVRIDRHDERLVVVDWQGEDLTAAPGLLYNTAKKMELGKVIFLSSAAAAPRLMSEGMAQEGVIRGFYNGSSAFCLVSYPDKERTVSSNPDKEEKIISQLLDTRVTSYAPDPGYYFVKGKEKDAPELAQFYQKIFATYPTPVGNPDFLEEIIREGKYIYMLARDQRGKLAAAASAELHSRWKSAEITDCATGKEHRAGGLMLHLVHLLERLLKDRGYLTLYSLARAPSWGINKVFRRAGYKYGGRLINNCHICGHFEDMNIWTKTIPAV